MKDVMQRDVRSEEYGMNATVCVCAVAGVVLKRCGRFVRDLLLSNLLIAPPAGRVCLPPHEQLGRMRDVRKIVTVWGVRACPVLFENFFL